jgi:metal-responsive CopG/Arc/MetJ family transcriptional regulator
MVIKHKATASHVVKVTGMSEDLLSLLDARVRERHAAGRAEYIRELIRRDVLPEHRLLEEYHTLVDQELDETLSVPQRGRLRVVEQALDRADAQEPKTQAMLTHLEKTIGKLDELLEAVRALPKAQREQ